MVKPGGAKDSCLQKAGRAGKEDVMYGGLILVVLVSLIVLSPVIWFAWWTLADLASADNTRRHGLA